MKNSVISRLFILVLVCTIACHDQDEIYPAEPHIEFVDVTFKKGRQTTSSDTLALTFSITDGDLDFGLNNSIEHLTFPYQLCYYYLKRDGTRISSDKLDRGDIKLESLIQFKDRSNPPYDTLPDLNCHYQTYATENDFTYLYADLNENAYNIFIEFYYQNPDGSYSEFNWYEEFCTSWNTRIIPINDLSKNEPAVTGPFTILMESSRKGKITYQMRSLAFKLIFKSKKMKLRINVKDRALNASNYVETPAFILE